MLEPFTLPFVQRGLLEVAALALRPGCSARGSSCAASRSTPTPSAPRPSRGSCSPPGSASRRCSARSPPPRSSPRSSACSARRERGGEDSLTALVLVGALALGVILLSSDVFHSRPGSTSCCSAACCSIGPATSRSPRPRASPPLAGDARARPALARARVRPGGARALGVRAGVPDAVLLALVALAAVASLCGRRARCCDGAARRPRGDHAALARPAARAGRSRRSRWCWSRASSGCGSRSSSTRRPGAAIAVLAGAASSSSRWRALAPRAGARRGGRRGRRGAGRSRGCGATGALDAGGRLRVVATTTQLADIARRSAATRVDVTQILRPNTDPHEYEPRPARRRATARREGRVAAATSSTRGWARSSTNAGGDADASSTAGLPASARREASPATRTGGTTRATPRTPSAGSARRSCRADPATPRVFERNAAAYLGGSARSTRGSRLHRRGPAARAQARHRPRRVRLFRRALRDQGRRRRHPVADDPGPAVGGELAGCRTSSAASTSARCSPRARSIRARPGDRARRPAHRRLHALRRHARAGGLATARPTSRWRRTTRTRWCAASPAGGGDARSRGERRVRRRRGATDWPSRLRRRSPVLGGRDVPPRGRASASRVLGPNGGGKTTLFRALLGELEPVAGGSSRRGRCAIVPQTERSRLDYPGERARRRADGHASRAAVVAASGPRRARAAREALDTVGLGRRWPRDLRRALRRPAPARADRPRARAGRAGAAPRRAVLGPRQAAAPSASWRCSTTSRPRAAALLIATHDVEQARAWDLVLCLNRRQIAFGPPEETLTLPSSSATYGGAIVELPGAGGRGVLPPHHHDH